METKRNLKTGYSIMYSFAIVPNPSQTPITPHPTPNTRKRGIHVLHLPSSQIINPHLYMMCGHKKKNNNKHFVFLNVY